MTYPWDDRTVLCSLPVDDLTLHEKWALIESQMTVAELTSSVLLLHAHTPDRSISRSALERVLKMAEIHHLAFLTFRELEPGAAPHAGLALAFDDTAIDSWFSIRDQLAAHRAHVTFFVTRWYASTEGERAELQTLADDGDDVEPHSVEHLHALQYVQDHGLDAYVADEVIPSIEVLTQAGYPAGNTFAYPFGQTTDEINDAVLRVVPRVRVSPGSCPY
jgi:peptidoglycan/xylan/chitin deacetylase (PgdA/CDA1 family)